jgi:hypothetical protein
MLGDARCSTGIGSIPEKTWWKQRMPSDYGDPIRAVCEEKAWNWIEQSPSSR